MHVITKKVSGGKLLRLKCGVIDGNIRSPEISGDFFLMPPEKIVFLEEALDGFPLDNTQELQEVLSYVIEREGIRLAGISVEDIISAVEELR